MVLITNQHHSDSRGESPHRRWFRALTVSRLSGGLVGGSALHPELLGLSESGYFPDARKPFPPLPARRWKPCDSSAAMAAIGLKSAEQLAAKAFPDRDRDGFRLERGGRGPGHRLCAAIRCHLDETLLEAGHSPRRRTWVGSPAKQCANLYVVLSAAGIAPPAADCRSIAKKRNAVLSGRCHQVRGPLCGGRGAPWPPRALRHPWRCASGCCLFLFRLRSGRNSSQS